MVLLFRVIRNGYFANQTRMILYCTFAVEIVDKNRAIFFFIVQVIDFNLEHCYLCAYANG